MTETRLVELQEITSKATSAPWGPYVCNLPFYAVVERPAPSCSKRDHSTYWRVEDAVFISTARVALPELIQEIFRLRKALEETDLRDQIPSLNKHHPISEF